MSDQLSVSSSRPGSEASSEAARKPANQLSGPDIARRDSRNTLPHPSHALSAAGLARMMHQQPSPPACYTAPGHSRYMSSAVSMGSAAMSNLSHQPYGMHARNATLPYAGSVMSSRGLSEIPTATSDNDYLGFCKGAWKAQNGDRKGAMEKSKEAQSWSRNAGRNTNSALAAHLKCQQPKCTFRSNYVSLDPSLIWDKVFTCAERGVKVRWRFLAQSHVHQKVVLKGQFAFKCLICVYMGKGASAGVYVGTDIYLEHINSEHRGQHFHDVMLYKIGCINDRVAEDDEDFDINIWPLSSHHEPARTEQYLSDSLLDDPELRPRGSSVAGMNYNQPWVVDVDEYEAYGVPQSSPPNTYSSPPIPQRSKARHFPAQTTSPQDMSPENTSPRNATASPGSCWPHQNTLAPPGNDLQRQLSAHTDESQSLALTTSLTNILQVFGEGSIIIEQLKAGMAVVRVPFIDILEQSLQDSPQDIQKEWQRGVQRFGTVYETGDYIAIIALSHLTFQLHTNVVDKLRRAIYGGESMDIAYLADSADLSRQQTITALHEFKQRLLQGPPQQIIQPSVPPTAAAAMQQAQQAQREAMMPRQHISHMRPDLWKDPYMPDATTRNTSLSSNKSSKGRESSESSESGVSRRRSSVLGTIREKASRKVSMPRSSQTRVVQSRRQDSLQSLPSIPDVDDLATYIQNDLSIHPALQHRGIQRNDSNLVEIAELDASSIRGTTG